MTEAQQAADDALQACDSLIKVLKKKDAKQVWGIDERATVKATCLAWFNNQRPLILQNTDQASLQSADSTYNTLLIRSGQAASRSGYLASLKDVRAELFEIRSSLMVKASAAAPQTTDTSPDFSKLVADVTMQAILMRRWSECVACISANAPMAATVMMGGLLEGLLLARVNRERNQKPIFTAKTVPKDKTGNPLPLKEWMLKNYIDVGHELGWISQSAKDVGSVLRDYRNYIHPQKELSHGVKLMKDDAALFWEVAKSIAKQVINS